MLKAEFQWFTDYNQIQPHLPGWTDGQREAPTARETHYVGERQLKPLDFLSLRNLYKLSLLTLII